MKEELKSFNIRMSHDIWIFLKYKSFQDGTSMNFIINECLNKFKKKIDNKLTKE